MVDREATHVDLLNYENIMLLDAKEVATMIKVAIKTVHERAREGKLAYVQFAPMTGDSLTNRSKERPPRKQT
ncbi:MAG: hypothetical protein HY912_11285 [Desulfomonile tiedjei]|uniref:Uncharacterized protein n=1 Tax=Desulfomonile tiedjei TaxID=2358 RepID=A0A9D6Z3P1_9BACT|nr:hypothetical protein [Desulfomonile tiedjei]